MASPTTAPPPSTTSNASATSSKKRTWSAAAIDHSPQATAQALVSFASSGRTADRHPGLNGSVSGVGAHSAMINGGQLHGPAAKRQSTSSPPGATGGPRQGGGRSTGNEEDQGLMLVTTRKSTACPACRKQKIKCIMENDMPPCKRCADRGLMCVQNKTVQDITKDQARWNTRMESHLHQLHNALNEARQALSLPPLPALEDLDSSGLHDESKRNNRDGAESGEEVLDMVEGNSMAPDELASAPIRSLYEVTRIRSLHPDAVGAPKASTSAGIVIEPDFVTRGVITLSEAEKLWELYSGRLDHFIYDHLQRYADLAEVRRTSTLLALTLCTIASLHDPLGSDMYDKLSTELRTLASSLMFRQRLGLEEVKALCMGSYWLPDIAAILSALVARKAASMQYFISHLNQPDTDKENFDRSQMWLLIYLCNQQISILQGAPSTGMGRDFVKCENHMKSPFAGENDRRMVSHIDLLLILSRARELYGLDTSKPVPSILVPQLRDFIMQLDRWGSTWNNQLARNKWLGNFPSEAVKLHWRFAKFYICSHAFRGLNPAFPPSISLPLDPASPTSSFNDMLDIASSAITIAISILQLLIESTELRASLIGVPHYFHTMFSFAAVFLLKVATRYRAHIDVDVPLVFDTCNAVLQIFGESPCARQHLVHRIARGLGEMIERCEAQVNSQTAVAAAQMNGDMNGHNASVGAMGGLVNGHQNGNPALGGGQMGTADGGAFDDGRGTFDMLQWPDFENTDLLTMLPASWNTDFII